MGIRSSSISPVGRPVGRIDSLLSDRTDFSSLSPLSSVSSASEEDCKFLPIDTALGMGDSSTLIADSPREFPRELQGKEGRDIHSSSLALQGIEVSQSQQSQSPAFIDRHRRESELPLRAEAKWQQVSRDPEGFMNRIEGEGLSEKLLVSRLIPAMTDYWTLIASRGVHIGISLTSLFRQHDTYPLSIGEWRVSRIDEDGNHELVKRCFQLTHLSTGKSRIFTHFTLEWANLDLPSVGPFRQLMSSYLDLMGSMEILMKASLETPLVHLHCQGGHGRSGTFLLARALLCQSSGACAGDLLSRLRQQRSRLVESGEQFEFAIAQAQALSGKSFERGKFSPFHHSRLNRDFAACTESADSDLDFHWSSSALPPYALASSAALMPLSRESDLGARLMARVAKDGMLLIQASSEQQDDIEIASRAVEQNSAAFQFVSPRLRCDEAFASRVVSRNGKLLKFAGESLKDDPRLALRAVRQSGLALEFVSERLKMSKEVVLEAVLEEGLALQFAGDPLKNDREVVAAAIDSDGTALEFASIEFRSDKSIVLQAINENGIAIKYASALCRADKELVLIAVAQNGVALEWVDPIFRSDSEVVITAIEENGCAIRYANPQLRGDAAIAFRAVSQNRNALRHISPDLQIQWRKKSGENPALA